MRPVTQMDEMGCKDITVKGSVVFMNEAIGAACMNAHIHQ